MRLFVFLSFLFFGLFTFSQDEEREIIGWVKIEKSEDFLEGVSVRILNTESTILEINSFTDHNGKFNIQLPFSTSEFRLIIDHIGYHQYAEEFSVTDQKINLDTISLKPSDNMLNMVVVQSKIPPILFKSDTAFFNAAYFRNPRIENAVELLEVLPGVTIDTDGIMYVNGVPVDKIMINGRPFFKDDFLLALEDLPADILETIQVTSTKTKSEAFANEEGNQNAKTVNLIISEDNYGGYSGNLGAGGGTKDRFELQGGINSFGNNGLFSVLAKAKNINDFNAINGQTNKNGNVNTSQNYGLNFSSQLSKKIDVNGNYFVTGSKQENETQRLRENFLPNSSFFSTNYSISESRSTTHSVNLGFDFKVNPTLLINIAPTLSIHKNESETFDSLASFQELNTIISGSSGAYAAQGSNKNIGNRLSITKKTGNQGNVLKFDISNRITLAKSERENLRDTYFNTDTGIYNLAQDQILQLNQINSNVTVGTYYKFGLTKQPFFITVGMTYSKQKNTEKSSVFDKNQNGEPLVFNIPLSNDFQLFSQELSPQIKFTYKNKSWSTNTALSQFHHVLDYEDILRPQNSLGRYYKGLLIASNVKYQINSKTSVNLSYKLTNEVPNIVQIQPFQNTLNPLYIIEGNPDLKVPENHKLNLNFQTFDAEKSSGIFAHVNAVIINDQVALKSTLDENLIQTSTFTNISGGYSFSANIRYAKSMVLDSGITFKFDLRLSPILRKNINLNNGYTYANRIVSLIPKVSSKVVFINKNVMEIGYQAFISNTSYELEQSVNQNLLRHQFHLTTDFHLFENCVWYNQLLYINSTSSNSAFEQSNTLWNSSITYKIFKQKIELSLIVYDALNRNVGVTQIATPEYIEDSERNVLNRYILLKLNWKFRATK